MRKKENFTIEYIKDDNSEKPKKLDFSALLSFSLYDFADSVIYALIAIAIVFLVFFRVFTVDGASMEDTLFDGDKVVVSAIGYTPKTGDIVVISETPKFNESLIKRVIACEGDTVDINFATGKVTVNSIELSEAYVKTPTNKQFDLAFPITVPDGCVFIMGDNRNDSLDSRTSLIGCVDEDFVIGKVLVRLGLGNWRVYEKAK